MTTEGRQRLSIGQCATLACVLEVHAPKPGNVHRHADFQDSTFQDFLISAVVVGSVLDQAPAKRIGELILESVDVTRRSIGHNTNLGLVLLLAPLAKAASTCSAPLEIRAVRAVLGNLETDDSRDVYAAIARARPGGLGASSKWDVSSDEPPDRLLDAMTLAADRDLVARQYVNGFEQVFGDVYFHLSSGLDAGLSLDDAIVQTHLQLMAAFPDSLIARKNGADVAEDASARAARVLKYPRGSAEFVQTLAGFDAWLREDGNKRNPGSTADLIGAGLFVALRNDMIKLPLQ